MESATGGSACFPVGPAMPAAWQAPSGCRAGRASGGWRAAAVAGGAIWRRAGLAAWLFQEPCFDHGARSGPAPWPGQRRDCAARPCKQGCSRAGWLSDAAGSKLQSEARREGPGGSPRVPLWSRSLITTHGAMPASRLDCSPHPGRAPAVLKSRRKHKGRCRGGGGGGRYYAAGGGRFTPLARTADGPPEWKQQQQVAGSREGISCSSSMAAAGPGTRRRRRPWPLSNACPPFAACAAAVAAAAAGAAAATCLRIGSCLPAPGSG